MEGRRRCRCRRGRRDGGSPARIKSTPSSVRRENIGSRRPRYHCARVGGSDGGQDQEEEEEGAFYWELELLGRLNHCHVVRLHGLYEGHNRFLVFDQMEKRSLKESDPLRTSLNWRTRLQVAIDVAAALEYLYYFCDSPVFHVTLNSSN